MEYVLIILGLLSLGYGLYLKKVYHNLIIFTNKSYENKYLELLEMQDYNQKIIDTFGANAQNKIHTVGISLLTLKNHYENTLRMLDEYGDEAVSEELRLSIETVNDQLKEIGFIVNKTKTCKSIIKNLHYLPDTDYSKN